MELRPRRRCFFVLDARRFCRRSSRCGAALPSHIRPRLRTIKVAPICECRARGLQHDEQKWSQRLHRGDANRSITFCQRVDLLSDYESRLHDGDLTRIILFRQGLWIEDLRTPPGQECSNGSLILLAVVPWRTFFRPPECETTQCQNRPLRASGGKMRSTASLHPLAETGTRSTFPIANQKQSRDDDSEERRRDGVRHRGIQGAQRRELSRVREIVEAI